MSMNITYRVRWLLDESQIDQAIAIQQKHEQSDAYLRFNEVENADTQHTWV